MYFFIKGFDVYTYYWVGISIIVSFYLKERKIFGFLKELFKFGGYNYWIYTPRKQIQITHKNECNSIIAH